MHSNMFGLCSPVDTPMAINFSDLMKTQIGLHALVGSGVLRLPRLAHSTSATLPRPRVICGHAACTCDSGPPSFSGVALRPPSVSLDPTRPASISLSMDPQLSIGTLLNAARMIDPKAPLSSLSPSILNVTAGASSTADFPSEVTDLRSLFGGKLRLDRKHGPPSTSAHPYCTSPNNKASKHSRVAHNELEKTRRANLRGCLETLKTIVPEIPEAARNTTLALLTRARDHIKELEDENTELMRKKRDMEDEQIRLLAELEHLQADEDVGTEKTIEATQNFASITTLTTAAADKTITTSVTSVCDAFSRPESRVSTVSVASFDSRDSRVSFESRGSRDYFRESPLFMEYSPSSKPTSSPRLTFLDLVAEGLVPENELPICFPRQTFPDYLRFKTVNLDVSTFLPINV